MESKKINLTFGVTAIAVLLVFYFMMKDYKARASNDIKDYVATVSNIITQKNNKIKVLSYQLFIKQREVEDLENTLADTRNSLDALSKKLAEPVPVAAVTAQPASVEK